MKLEAFDYTEHIREKSNYAAALRTYFIQKVEAGDSRTVEELVKINCLVDLDDSSN